MGLHPSPDFKNVTNNPNAVICQRCGVKFDSKIYMIAGRVVCGICSIILTGQPPAVVGVNHPREVNPDKYEPVKEQSIAIEWMEKQPVGSPNHINYRTAARWKKKFVGRSEQIEIQKQKTPERLGKEQAELQRSMEKMQMDEINTRIKQSETRLKAIDQAVRIYGITD